MPDVADTLRARVIALLEARPELSNADFGRMIRRGQSWLSEFRSGRRTTNDLRLVMAMARCFRVPVGYLIGETPAAAQDAGLTTLVATYAELSPRDRELLLAMASNLRRAPEKKSATGRDQ